MKRRILLGIGLTIVMLAVVASWATWVTDPELRWNSLKPQLAEAQAATSTRFTLLGGTVAEGAVGEFLLLGDTFPNGLSGFKVTIEPVDPTIARVIGFISPDYGLVQTGTFGVAPGGLSLNVADILQVVNPGDFDPILTTARIEGLRSGTTTFTVTVSQMPPDAAVDESGTLIVAVNVAAIITVSASRDLDGDGLTEDFNGNGVLDFGDVVALWDLIVASP